MNGRTFSPNFCKGGKSHHHLIDGSRYRMVDYRPEVAKEPPPPPPSLLLCRLTLSVLQLCGLLSCQSLRVCSPTVQYAGCFIQSVIRVLAVHPRRFTSLFEKWLLFIVYELDCICSIFIRLLLTERQTKTTKMPVKLVFGCYLKNDCCLWAWLHLFHFYSFTTNWKTNKNNKNACRTGLWWKIVVDFDGSGSVSLTISPLVIHDVLLEWNLKTFISRKKLLSL